MNLEKVSAERDALVLALKRAEDEIARARTAQQQAEARLAEFRTRSGAVIPPARNDNDQVAVVQVRAAQAAQKRAETMARTLDEQLREQKAEQDKLRAELDALKAENETLRERNEALHGQNEEFHNRNEALQKQQKKPESPDVPASTPASRAEQRSLRDELDVAWAEIQRLRALVVRVASEGRKGTVPPEIAAALKTDSRIGGSPQPAPTAPAAKSSKTEVDCGPKSGARRAA